MPASLARRQHQRRQLAVGRRHHHHQPRHARDLGGHRVHQHRRRIGGGAAGHVEADRLDRGPAAAELDPERVGEAFVGGLLAAVIGLDPVAGERERIERPAVAGGVGGVDLGGRDLEAELAQVDAVELARELDERAVAAGDDIGDDRAHGRFDVGGGLALGGKKGPETFGETVSARVQADRHGPFLPGRPRPVHRSMARAVVGVNPGRRGPYRRGPVAPPPARPAPDRPARPPGIRPRAAACRRPRRSGSRRRRADPARKIRPPGD